jgi:phenylacetic acid degradation protein paaN
MTLFEKHQETINKAVIALHQRTFFAAFPEHPSPAVYGENADNMGSQKFQDTLGKPFTELLQADPDSWEGSEESPYLGEPLNITYPIFTVETLIERAKDSFHVWRKQSIDARAGLLVESLMRVKNRFFEIAYATMHTTGQGYMMSFQASGPHAADRALEAIAAGYEELKRFPEKTTWDKPMGKINVQLSKEWRAVPKGVGVVIGCSTFPTWNSVTGIYADLMTGNSVIVKPHPGAVLPIAIVVAEIQKVLQENGISPLVCQLAVDNPENPITKLLAEHPDVKLIDFTGNSVFGDYLESIPGKAVFTEKTGVNSVILDSVEDLDKVAANLAFSLCLYSGQMCTAPQNFYIPATGVKTLHGIVPYDEVVSKLKENILGLVDNPKAGAFVLGAIQNQRTQERIRTAESLKGNVLLRSKPVAHPQFPNARIASPMLIEVDAAEKDLFGKELFGPIAFVIKTKDTGHSLALAKEMAIHQGAISCGAYTTDQQIMENIADDLALAGTPVSFNLTGGIYMNQNAAFSDFHVTGGNPAGNASFTNPEYVNKRFTWVGHRQPAVVY